MGNSLHLKKILATARTEYVKWLCNERMVLLVVLFLYIHNTVIAPLLENADKMNSPINALEPFIATLNSDLMTLFLPVMFLVLFSDFPRKDGNTLFFLLRIGKTNWILGQLLFAIYAIITYFLILFLMCVLPVVNKGFWYNGWSLVVTDFGQKFPKEAMNLGASLIKKNIYNQVSPMNALLHSVLLTALFLFLIACILMLFNALKQKVFGVVVVAGITSIGTLLYLFGIKAMWLFPTAHTIIVSHFTMYLKKGGVPIWASYCYLVVLIVILVVASIYSMKKMNFESVQEMD